MGQDETTGHTEHVREGLDTTVGTGLEEQECTKLALFAGQVLHDVEAKTSVEAQSKCVMVRLPGDVGTPGARSFGDVVRILFIAFVILSKAFLEPIHPTWIERVELQVVRLKLSLKQNRGNKNVLQNKKP